MKLVLLFALICICVIPKSEGQSVEELNSELNMLEKAIDLRFRHILEDMDKKVNEVCLE